MFLIKHPDKPPFISNTFHAPSMWVDGMLVVNLDTKMYFNGKKWIALEVD